MLSEDQGCRILENAFRRRGYAITRSVPFDEGGVTCELDGWDAAQRVGFEYLSRSDGDHDDLTPEELALLVPRIEGGELYLLIIDEVQVEDADELLFAADRFLDEVERRRGTRPPLPARPATTPAAKGKAAKKKPTRKAAKKKPTRKAAKKKPTRKAAQKKPTRTAARKKPAKKAARKKPAKKAAKKMPATKAAKKKPTKQKRGARR